MWIASKRGVIRLQGIFTPTFRSCLAHEDMPQFQFCLRVSPSRRGWRARGYPSNPVLPRVRRRAEPVRHSQPQRPDAKESYGNGPRLGYIGLDLRPRQATIERFRHGPTAPPTREPPGGCDCPRLGAIGGNPQYLPQPPPHANHSRHPAPTHPPPPPTPP